MSALQPWDIAILIFVGLSALWGFARGFVREVLGVAAWVGAAAVTYYFFDPIKGFTHKFIDNDMVAGAAGGIALFLLALILFSLVSSAISVRVKGSALHALDRTLGFVFGVARGAFLVCFVYFAYQKVALPKAPPADLAAARLWPLLNKGVDWMQGIVPPQGLGDAAQAAADATRAQADKAVAAEQLLKTLNSPPAKPTSGHDGGGYTTQQTKDLDRLIEGQQQNGSQ